MNQQVMITIPLEEFEAIVQRCVDKAIDKKIVNTKSVSDQSALSKWYPASRAYEMLGLASAETLRKMIGDPLRVGIEVKNIAKSTALCARYLFDVEKCKERLSIPPEKRMMKIKKPAV